MGIKVPLQKKFRHPYALRTNTGGNFCGHSPLTPLLSVLPEHKIGTKGIPRVLTLMIERTQVFFKKPHKIPSLNHANGSPRNQRSERREACIRVLNVLLEYTDLETLCVGIPNINGMKFLNNKCIAKKALMPIKRAQRALSDLARAGIVSIKKRFENKSTDPKKPKYRSLISIKRINPILFKLFGLNRVLEKERKKAAKRRSKKNALGTESIQSSDTSSAKIKNFIHPHQNHRTQFGASQDKDLAAREKRCVTHQRLLALLIGEIHQEKPNLAILECQKLAQEMLNQPSFYTHYLKQHT